MTKIIISNKNTTIYEPSDIFSSTEKILRESSPQAVAKRGVARAYIFKGGEGKTGRDRERKDNE